MSFSVVHGPPEISVLIVCYKSLALIGPTLAGLYEHTAGVNFEVLLTDCSDDGTIEWVRDHYPQVKIVPASGNLGFAAGNNFLARHAGGQFLLLLNPDVIIDHNAVGILHQCAMKNPDGGAWGGQTILPSGKIDPGSQQSTPTLMRLAMAAIGLERRTIGGLSSDATDAEQVEGLSGAFLLIRRDRWDAMNGFDETFFMYAEELDLCFRLRATGHPLYMTPIAHVTHLVGSGSALNPRRATSIAKAKMHFLRKHRGVLYTALAAVLYWSAAVARVGRGCVDGYIRRSDRGRQLAAAHWPVVAGRDRWFRGYPSA